MPESSQYLNAAQIISGTIMLYETVLILIYAEPVILTPDTKMGQLILNKT